MHNLSEPAQNHVIEEAYKLYGVLRTLLAQGAKSTKDNEEFAKRLSDSLIACSVFISNTKNQHRTLCDIMKGKRA